MAVQPHKMTSREFLAAFPDDGVRRELIHGEVIVPPAPNVRHQEVTGRTFARFLVHLEEHGGGRVFIAPLDVVLSDDEVVEPDVIFVSDEDESILTRANIQGRPTLVIEVLADPRRDRVVKRAIYEQMGIPEYVVMDPDADRLEVHRLREGSYGTPEILEPGDVYSPHCLPGLVLDVADLLRRN